MNTMRYKDYEASITFDPEAELFHGEVLDINDTITFQGRSVDELKQALADSVEDYLAFCAERGESPDKPFSGQFVVRIGPDLHRSCVRSARRSGKSLNRWVTEALEAAVFFGEIEGKVNESSGQLDDLETAMEKIKAETAKAITKGRLSGFPDMVADFMGVQSSRSRSRRP